jgi:hypothetical protein
MGDVTPGVSTLSRYALHALATVAPDWLQRQVTPDWFDRSSHRMEAYRLPSTNEERQQLAVTMCAHAVPKPKRGPGR